jgi:hypothetical protein
MMTHEAVEMLAVSIMTVIPNHAKANLYRLMTRTDNGKVQMPLIMHKCWQQFFKTAMFGVGQNQTVWMAMSVVSEASGDIQDVNLHVERNMRMKT